MKQLKRVVIGVALGLTAQVSMAEDYAYLFNPATMTVGQTVGEYLVVKEYCPKTNCTTAEKQKYVTSVDGRTGRLEIPVNAGNDFEISFNVQSYSTCTTSVSTGSDFTITLYLSDNSSVPISIGACTTRVYAEGINGETLNWIAGVNDLRLISEQGVLKISANDTFIDGKLSLSGTINRIVLSKINAGQENFFEIRTRGIQKASSASCPTPTTGNCTAKYTSTGKVSIPCIEVPVGFSTQVYSVEMQQRTGSFTFDLNMSSVKPR